MTEEKEKSLSEFFDNDQGVIKSRRILMTLSILLLISTLGEINIKEANTLFFKLEISNPPQIKFILALALFFSTIRYYSFAYGYHKKIKESWCKKMISDTRVITPNWDDIPYYPSSPALLDHVIDVIEFQFIARGSLSYQAKFPLRRCLVYWTNTPEHPDIHMKNQVSIYSGKQGIAKYLKALKIEFHYRIETIFRTPIYLGVYFPYWLSLITIILYFFYPETTIPDVSTATQS